MSQINRTGTFRGVAVDCGVAESSGGFPQWVASLQAAEYYDEETEQWIDWSEYEEKEIPCYLVLFGNEGTPLLNMRQLQKAFGWSGESFQELETFTNVPFQFRVEEKTYEGNTNLRVQWVDAYDAEPGRVIQKLEPAEVKKLDTKYAAALRKFSGGPKPKTVPDKPDKPPIPTVDKSAAKETLKAQAAEKAQRGAKAEAKAAKREKKEKLAKPPIPKAAPAPTTPPQTTTETPSCTKDEAWEKCYEAKGKLTDDQIATIWLRVIDEQGGEDNLDAQGWGVVCETVVREVSVPI